MAYEDVRLLPTLLGGRQARRYAGSAVLEHVNRVRGSEVGERERSSQRYFWQRWGEFSMHGTSGPTAALCGRLCD